VGDPPVSASPPDDPGRTIVRPNPGGRVGRGSAPADPGFGASTDPLAGLAPAGTDTSAAWTVGRNPLLAAASPLLVMIGRIRATLSLPDPDRLRTALADAVRAFETDAHAAGVPRDRIVGARYLLCTFVDEAAAGTPWGGTGVWARDSLLVRFHNEAWGGEKSFQLLSKLAENPTAHRDLLEVFYVCLSLGFEGRYRVLDNGRAQLESLRERLHAMLAAHTPAGDGALSGRWAPTRVARRSWSDGTPVWVFCALSLLLAFGLYLTYSTLLAGSSDPVFARLAQLRLPAPAVAVAAPAPPPLAQPRLAITLGPEIKQGLLSVTEDGQRSVVLIQGDGLFAPGSAQLDDRVLPVLARVGAALREHPGTVRVSGHTDAQPIRSARFPSNWHLSQERAREVARILGDSIGAQRLQAEGRADAEPVAPNDTPANRARNRRVEITLFATR